MNTFPRQEKLDPILQELRKLPGLKSVNQDDFDSAGINVFFYLDDLNSRSGSICGKKPYRFAVPIRSIKAKIRKALKDVSFNFLDWPSIEYQWNGQENVKDGYSGDSIKIEIFV